ncbi:MAG TPA: nuclear transport factor 2 family protein [Terracidiphilus sp.]|nr:nuclear transport factor 2 family protein [Terracidiphilus sp.]
MSRAPSFLVLALLLLAALPAAPQGAKPSAAAPKNADEIAIRAAIAAQVAAWNRDNIPAFMRSYEDSPSTTFIGSTVQHGFQPILQRYRQAYTSPAQMGTLTFSDLTVRLLPGSCGNVEYAIVTGRFHLARTTRGAAQKDDGIFSLVWRKDPAGWRIILDHTS